MIPLETWKPLLAQGVDPIALALDIAVDNNIYPIGNTGYGAALDTYDAVVITYGFKTSIQEIVDKKAAEASKHKRPDIFMENYLQNMKKSLSAFRGFGDLRKYSDKAFSYVENTPDLIKTRECCIRPVILIEDKNGRYREWTSDKADNQDLPE